MDIRSATEILYLVTNSDNFKSESEFLETISLACQGGVTLVQLREKEKTGREYYELALKVKEVTDKFKIPLIIDDRVDIALAAGTAGVHLGQEDLPIAAARKIMGPKAIIGATAKTVPHAKAAEAAGADYLGVGAIYPTKTKVKTVITSVETLRDIVDNTDIPAIAIGGLTAKNLDILKGSGAKGIAVVNAIMSDINPKGAAAELITLVRSIKF